MSNQIGQNLTQEQHDQIVRNGIGYEPSVPVKRTYLSLRKKQRLWGGVTYPGLFDYDPANDVGWFWFTVTMEVISLGITSFLLEERITASVLAISALCVFCLDFAFAYFHHRFKATECFIENQKRLFLPEMRPGIMSGTFADYVAHLDQKLKDDKDRKIFRYFFAFMIWILSVIKGGLFFIAVVSSYWFQMAVSDSKTPYLLIIVIVASYLWIAYNHLNYTGYFIASWWRQRKQASENADYNRKVGSQQAVNEREVQEEKIDLNKFMIAVSSDNTNPYLRHFVKKSRNDLEAELNKGINEIQIQPHSVYKTDAEQIFIVRRCGLLTDDQLQKMIDVQPTDLARLAVAMYGHKLQMQSGNFIN
jgi:hypothetical protein